MKHCSAHVLLPVWLSPGSPKLPQEVTLDDRSDHSSRESQLTVAKPKFLISEPKVAEGVCCERGREGEAHSGESVLPLDSLSAFVVWCCCLPVLSMSCSDQLQCLVEVFKVPHKCSKKPVVMAEWGVKIRRKYWCWFCTDFHPSLTHTGLRFLPRC